MEIFDMSSDISISIDPHSAPIVGDYYYTDNSYSTQMLDKKENCVGVVFMSVQVRETRYLPMIAS